jgi:hypothetical protein
MAGEWVSTTRAAAALGVTGKYLLRHRGSLFKPGVHYLNLNPQAWRPTYRWNLPALQQLLGQQDLSQQLGERFKR